MSESKGHSAYAALCAHLREAEVLSSAVSVLSWDQETGMPEKGGALRADQLSLLSGLVHARHVDARVGDWLSECEADASLLADETHAANVREIRRDYDRAVRLPESLVREFAQATALAQQTWRDARERSDFSAFAPALAGVMSLVRARAECLRADPSTSLYDVLLDAYEPGARAEEMSGVFGALRERLSPLILEFAEASASTAEYRHAPIPIPAQAAFNAHVARAVGFDFEAGRLDVSTHPFCEGIGPGDTRLTTRYREDNFTDSLSSSLHELGHGLYEQGLPKAAHLGQPIGAAASLGIHESQSRLWENMVGRSRSFWEWALPSARSLLGATVEDCDVESVYRAVNRVRPNLIRVDSDEATYNLHIMLRFDLERAMLTEDLAIGDLPGEWNRRIRQDLGIEVPDDRRGCLQDIHWSMGAVGYFPTYSLGNLYAAQLWSAIDSALPDLQENIARGEFGSLLDWLGENIHRHGRRYSATELSVRATGSELSAEPFLTYLTDKLRPIYSA